MPPQSRFRLNWRALAEIERAVKETHDYGHAAPRIWIKCDDALKCAAALRATHSAVATNERVAWLIECPSFPLRYYQSGPRVGLDALHGEFITDPWQADQFSAKDGAETFVMALKTTPRFAEYEMRAVCHEFTAPSATSASLAARCRPAVAHYMRTQQRAAMSEALSAGAKEAAEKEAAWLGRLLDEIDALRGEADRGTE